MDSTVLVALIGALSVIAAAWLTRPSRQTHRAVRRIEGEFHTNGGSSTRDQLNRIEGRLDQHLTEATEDKKLAHKEAIEMWKAIHAVSDARPKENP